MKAIILKSRFLDILPGNTKVMISIQKLQSFLWMCCQIYIFHCPLRKKSASQRTPTEIIKTCFIAKVRILVQQVLRHLNIFRIISNEVPTSFLILVVCSA